MDSGNSGSIQSSSGGDGDGVGPENIDLSTHYSPIPLLQQQSNYTLNPTSFSHTNPNPNPIYNNNLDSLWSRIPNPNPNPNPIQNLDQYLNPNTVNDNINLEPDKLTKNPKKRTRASRRAPTTVLTTDTTNFRQMVQEFTGIPPAPFATSSPTSSFSRYGGGITPMIPLRPSAQKIQLQPYYTNIVKGNPVNSVGLNYDTMSNFQLPPSETYESAKQSFGLSSLQNEMFQFQSLSRSTLQVNTMERENQSLENTCAYLGSSSTSMKRWRGEDVSLTNIGDGEGNSQNDIFLLRIDNDRLSSKGNEDSWICPSN